MKPEDGTDSGAEALETDVMDVLLFEAAHRKAYIDDAGFTAAVMARVPPPVNLALRRRILLGSAVIATVFGLFAFDGAAYIWQAVIDLVALGRFGSAQLGVIVFALMFYWGLYRTARGEVER